MQAFLTLLRTAWRYAEGRRHLLVLHVCMFAIANAILLLEPYAIGRLLTSIQRARELLHPFREMTFSFMLLLVIPIVFWALHGPARVIERMVAFHATAAFGDHLYRIVTSLPVQWHRDHHSGQTINRMRKATRALRDFMSESYNFIEMTIRLVGSVVVLTLILPAAAGIALLVSVGALGVVFLFDRVLLRAYEAINEREHFVASALHDYVTNIVTVITLRLEKLTQSELWDRMTRYVPLFRRTAVINEWKWCLTTVVISLMTVVVLAWYAWAELRAGQVILVGTFYMLYDYLQKIGSAFYTFAWKYSNTVEQYADLQSARSILQAERARYYRTERLPEDWQRIEISDLHFTYEDEEHRHHVLVDIALTLERGKSIALIGPSGSGKSTFMVLLRGLHMSERVRVRCDGSELPHGLRHLAQHVTLIPQDPEIFSNTIEYNVTCDTRQSKEEILGDIALARFDAVLARLPRGLKTDIAEKGVNLSGGEKQRLALARGIFAAKTSDILLLDEPTSSVDAGNEIAIYRNLFQRFRDRCIVSSFHRLHLLPLFDEVYVLEKGRIVERGKPSELISGSGKLAEMWGTYMAEQKDQDITDSAERRHPQDISGVPTTQDQSGEA